MTHVIYGIVTQSINPFVPKNQLVKIHINNGNIVAVYGKNGGTVLSKDQARFIKYEAVSNIL